MTWLNAFKIFGDSWLWSGLVWALILAGIGLVILYLQPIRKFVREVKVELFKASWPWDNKEKGFKKYKELVDSTMIVVIAMLLLAGYIALWDFLLVNIVSWTTGSQVR